MLCWSCRPLSCVKRPISDDNVPEKLLSLRIKVFKLVKRPISEDKKGVKSINSEGSRPDRLLEPSSNDVVVSGSYKSLCLLQFDGFVLARKVFTASIAC